MKNSNYLLTVVTLTMNSERYIAKSINSFNKAKEKISADLVRHIFVDSNSNDNTIKIIKKDSPDSEILLNAPNGLYASINYVLKKAVSTPFVTYLHSDDEIDDKYLEIMIKNIKKNLISNNSVLVASVQFIDKDNNILYSRKPPFYFKFIQKYTNLIFHPNAVYPTEIEKKYPYDELIGRSADSKHIIEIMNYAKHIRVSDAIYKFRISNSSITFNAGKLIPHNKMIFIRLYIHLFENKIIKRFLMKIKGKSFWL